MNNSNSTSNTQVTPSTTTDEPDIVPEAVGQYGVIIYERYRDMVWAIFKHTKQPTIAHVNKILDSMDLLEMDLASLRRYLTGD